MKETEDDTNEWKDIECSWIGIMFFFLWFKDLLSYKQNILLVALAKDQCKNTTQFCNCQFKKFCSSGWKVQACILASG